MSEFQLHKAVRKNVPLLIGLVGPSGGGKTMSALRLATGIKNVQGGSICYIDTEADRALHYANQFDFQHLPFGAPFAPSRYLEAIRLCVKEGAKTVVVDSMSHEHEGPGGVLEMHDFEVERMEEADRKKGWKVTPGKHNFRAWSKPKAERRALINALLQMRCNFIFCFRAKSKTKPGKKTDKNGRERDELEQLGWMPIAGEEFVYEMTVNALLLPNADGVPTWNPEREGERAMVKQPSQFRDLFKRHAGKPLSEEMGEEMARWAAGGASPAAKDEPFRFPNGKHAGKTAREVSADYLTWCIENKKGPVELFEAEIERRITDGEP